MHVLKTWVNSLTWPVRETTRLKLFCVRQWTGCWLCWLTKYLYKYFNPSVVGLNKVVYDLTVKDYKFHPSCLAFYWKVIEYMQNKTWKLNWAIFSISWSIVHKTFLRKQDNWSKLKSEVWGLENSDIALGGAYSLSFSLEENCCLLLEILKYSSGYWYLKQMNCAWYQTTTSKVMCCSPAVIRID